MPDTSTRTYTCTGCGEVFAGMPHDALDDGVNWCSACAPRDEAKDCPACGDPVAACACDCREDRDEYYPSGWEPLS